MEDNEIINYKEDNKEDKYKLINGDCLEEMIKIKDKRIDLIICDLPYGMTKNKWINRYSM